MNRLKNVKVFDTARELNEAAARFCLNIANEAISKRGRFTFCLSGGSTPRGLYALLSSEPCKNKFPWNNTFLFWGDERCVPFQDGRNNAHMAYETLIDKVAIPGSNIFPIPVDLPPFDAAQEYEQTILQFFVEEQPCFDLILLGLGEDGHTASLFPGTSVLNEKKRLVKEVIVDDDRLNRITMTAPLINMAHHILFLVSGANKAEILSKVTTISTQPPQFPAQLITPQNGDLTWYVTLNKNMNAER
ncbi:MAG: 6-phosphogluconolactonase [Chloroflexota bacterium]|nr:6-phosphogluconolactonase [Bacteroidales bacterium]